MAAEPVSPTATTKATVWLKHFCTDDTLREVTEGITRLFLM
jgi:hypothetical protein